QYSQLVANMNEAASSCESICATCGIQFVYKSNQDSNPSVDSTNFVLRLYPEAEGQFVAQAFYPHDAPARRYLNLDPSYFTTGYNKIGVLRHELGHVLGYRHEHIQPTAIEGCYQAEDSQWRRLTDYDALSVMHY